jgi:serine/threonine-protein kinase
MAGCGDPLVVQGDAPGFMRVVAGIPDSLGVRIDSLATRSRLTDPSAVGFDGATDLLYVVDRGALLQQGGITQHVGRIMSVDSRARLRLLVDGGGCTPGPCLHAAAQMTPGAPGSFLLADPVGHRILRFDIATASLTPVSGTGAAAFTADGAMATGASLRTPSGIARAEDGTIYFSEQGGSVVRYIDPAGVLHTLAGTGVADYTGDGGPATAATLRSPGALALGNETLYIADVGSHTVRTVDLSTGIISTLVGTGGPGTGGDGGPAILAQLFVPSGLVLSEDGGLLYIADRENNRVRVVNLANGTIATFAGTGSRVFNGSRGPAGDLSLQRPNGLAIAGRGFLYIADTGHQVVWRAAVTF